MTCHVAVIDIGKTNAKLALVDRDSLIEIAVITRPNTVCPGPPWPHYNVDGHWAFVLEGLRVFQASHGIDAISITTHGACAALLDRDGALAAPILDYECAGPDSIASEYDAIRPAFSETGSPRLAAGLNIGAQLFWQFKTDPSLHGRTDQIVTYPQYWGARLTGRSATDVTSLGCHTDLWNPHTGQGSSVLDAMDIADKLAPVHKPFDVLGPILPQVAAQTGLPIGTPVYCGIHDSNASLLPYILSETPPFSVVSTGTWVIAMSMGGQAVHLDPALDTVMNVTALGDPAPSARFMGGREFEVATGGSCPDPTPEDLEAVLANALMLLPALVPETGPFRGQRAEWLGRAPEIGTGSRMAAVGLYLALVSAACLDNIGHRGQVIVEGPFASNRVYLEMLSVASRSDVLCASGTTGTSAGAALLVPGSSPTPMNDATKVPVSKERAASLKDYARRWQKAVFERGLAPKT